MKQFLHSEFVVNKKQEDFRPSTALIKRPDLDIKYAAYKKSLKKYNNINSY